MAAPKTNTDFSDWKTFEVPDGNVSVRVPPKWNATSHGGGINHITAPSGYSVAVLTNGKTVLNCQAKTPLEPSEKLATLPMTVVAVDGISRPLEIWWQDATWHPAEIWLSVVQPSKEDVICSQVPIDYGGKSPVSVGSADNLKNPTREELNQAAAILASLTRLS